MVHHSVRHMSGIYQNSSASQQPIATSIFYRQQLGQQRVQQRELAISSSASQTNLCSLLQVETSVEYDLPSHIYPPKNSSPILMVHPDFTTKVKDPRKQSTRRTNSRASNFQSPNASYNSSKNEYINCNGKRCNGKSSSTSIAKACYTATSSNNSPSSYAKSLNSSRTAYRQPAMIIDNTQQYVNSVVRQKQRQSLQNQMHQIKHQQQNVAASMIQQQQQQQQHRHIKYPTVQPPSYGTATRLSGLIPQAAHANGISTPMIASVVPADLKPQIMSTADTVRSRGSPKLRASTRRHAAAPDYQLRRNRSNTIGTQSNLANTSNNSTSSLATYEITSSLALLQMQKRNPQLQQYDQLMSGSNGKMTQRHPVSNPRSESDYVYSENNLKNVSAVPYIYEGRVADTPHMISGPLTPSEMMDQDPFPSRGMMSSVESSSTPNIMSQDSSRHLRYSDVKKPNLSDNGIESAKHFHQISSSNSNGRHHIKDKNENYWYPEAPKKSSDPKSHHNVAHSRAHGNSKTSAEVRLKGCDRNNVWLKHLSNLFEDSLGSPIDLTSPAKSSTEFSPSASLLSSQLLGVPTPPVSNLTNGSGSIFQSNTSNFINNIYQLSNITPIINFAY